MKPEVKPIKLSEMRAVCTLATEGPWEGDKVSVITSRKQPAGTRRRIVAQCYPSEPPRICPHCNEPVDQPAISNEEARANRDLIILARNAFPALVEFVDFYLGDHAPEPARKALASWFAKRGIEVDG